MTDERTWIQRVGSRVSQLLNRVTTDRDEHLTFSAKSWALALEGRAIGHVRVAVVDTLFFVYEGLRWGHCERAWVWWTLQRRPETIVGEVRYGEAPAAPAGADTETR